MIKVKLSSSRGKKLFEMGSHYEGVYLYQIYDRYSDAKRRAFEWCYNEYLNSDNHDGFSIISYNTFGFSVSWLCEIDGVDGMRIETPKNSYFIEFDCKL